MHTRRPVSCKDARVPAERPRAGCRTTNDGCQSIHQSTLGTANREARRRQEIPEHKPHAQLGPKPTIRDQRTRAAARVRPTGLSICAQGHRSCASLQPRTPRQWLQHRQPYWSASAPPATKPSIPPPQAGPMPVQARPACKAYAIAPGQRSASPPQGYRQKSARASPRLAAREGAGPPSGLPRPQQPASQSPPEGPLMPRPPS